MSNGEQHGLEHLAAGNPELHDAGGELVDPADWANEIISRAERNAPAGNEAAARKEIARAASELLQENVPAEEREWNLLVIGELLSHLAQ